MKLGKNGTALCAVALGISILTTSALADVLVGSGYRSLKDATKATAAYLTQEAQSFSANVNICFRENDSVISSFDSCMKYDLVNGRREDVESSVIRGIENGNYYYRDSEMSASRYTSDEENDDTMYVNVFDEARTDDVKLENPFDEEIAQDLENVADAFVGSLQDIVQKEESEGKTMYICNLDSVQIPMYINALASFGIKQGLFSGYSAEKMKLPKIKKDVYISSANAKAIENEEGLLSSLVGLCEFKGKDENDNEHTFTVELSYTLYDINATSVEKPDISNAEVNYESSGGYVEGFSQKNVGVYKIPIIKTENDTTVKIGERTLEITSVADGSVNGRYYETYKEGEKNDALSFDFTAEFNEDIYGVVFDYTNTNGETEKGILRQSGSEQGTMCYILFGVEIFEDGGYSNEYGYDLARVFED